MKKILASVALWGVPAIAFAQAGVQGLLIAILTFLNSVLIPFIFTLAFLFFLVNAVRYFIIGGGNETERDKARRFALWGILAFVLMVSIWGIANLLTSGFGIDRTVPVCPDYIPPGQDCNLPARGR